MKGLLHRRLGLLLAALTIAALSGGTASYLWSDDSVAPASVSLSSWSDDDYEAFLRRAKVVSMELIGSGVTKPYKVRLERDGVSLKAAFKTVDFRTNRARMADGSVQLGFSDSYHYERAAYLVARRIGLRNVPVTVVRSIRGEAGALTLWIEDAATEKQRRRDGVENSDAMEFQRELMKVFDALIQNDDRNLGNQLITSDDRLHMIDHSRSFRAAGELSERFLAERCRLTHELLEQIASLEAPALKKLLRSHLNGKQIKAILTRRDLILQKFELDRGNHGDETMLTDWTHLH